MAEHVNNTAEHPNVVKCERCGTVVPRVGSCPVCRTRRLSSIEYAELFWEEV